MQDEMTSWLYYPSDDNSLETYLYSNDLLYPTPSFSAPVAVAPTYVPPPPPPPPSVILPSRSSKITPELQSSAIVASNATPTPSAGTPESKASRVSDKPAAISVGNDGVIRSTSGFGAAGTSSAGREIETYEMSVTSSPGVWSRHLKSYRRQLMIGNASPEIPTTRKSIMRALNMFTSDKASLLDEAIEYLKALQMQVQMMSTQCSMVPMMFLGAQHYMPPMAMGMGMNRATFPYPPVLPGSSLPNPAEAVPTSAAHLRQCYPVPGFNMTPGTVGDPTANLSAPMMSSLTLDGQNQPRAHNFTDPFQQYHGLHQTRLPFPQVD
ncbi:hypothetical protein L1987_03935 [Smallanthus sonchifolius]|uniref:Uncharacterized protein n=1 Tax=Smallanthus sonchifolius TaxID=185202 RepID=A0ACB9KC27_9ASTR|nr:hypothetical protein L1987_03935 [Smallanthus sonchifolius]